MLYCLFHGYIRFQISTTLKFHFSFPKKKKKNLKQYFRHQSAAAHPGGDLTPLPLRTFWMSVMSMSLMTLFLLEELDLELELSKHRWLRRQERVEVLLRQSWEIRAEAGSNTTHQYSGIDAPPRRGDLCRHWDCWVNKEGELKNWIKGPPAAATKEEHKSS